MIELSGITWNHTRGYLPMVATAQRFSELHPEIMIRWEKRTLQQFADLSLQELTERFDLIVMDHPFTGTAVEGNLLLPLDKLLSANFLSDQASHSVGKSHESYEWNDHSWALAIDAATPVCGWRKDILESQGLSVPRTWGELIELARRGVVVVPGIPLDSLMHFYMLCTGLGEAPFSSDDNDLISKDVGVCALRMLKELYSLVSPECAHHNPIAIWDLLTESDKAAICPFAYGYSNYSRSSFTSHPIETGGLISIEGHGQCRSTLGGAGLAISSKCLNIESAVQYCQYVACAETQRGLYFQSGGQPGHRSAWLSESVNRESHHFFQATLSTLDEAWLRPRWNGYLDFQSSASVMVHEYLWGGGHAGDIVARLNEMAQQTMIAPGNRSRG